MPIDWQLLAKVKEGGPKLPRKTILSIGCPVVVSESRTLRRVRSIDRAGVTSQIGLRIFERPAELGRGQMPVLAQILGISGADMHHQFIQAGLEVGC